MKGEAMQQSAINEAASTLFRLRDHRSMLAELPEGAKPATLAEAHAIQDALIAMTGERVAGWKMNVTPAGEVMRGAMLASRIWATPASVPAALVPLLGAEAEIAFRLDRDLPARGSDYSRDEIEAAVSALPAIEVVDTRFASYDAAPPLERAADLMSNGGFVPGPVLAGWRGRDLSAIEVVFEVDGEIIVQQRGGHGAGDPLLPAIALINEFRRGPGLAAGTFLTTGTYTGLRFVKPGQRVVVRFEGGSAVEITFTA